MVLHLNSAKLRHLCRRPADSGRREGGNVLILWTLALAALCGLVAMAIDLGNIGQTKQHAANAAENAVLSAVPDLAQLVKGEDPSTAEATAVNDAERYLTATFNIPSPNWTGCGGFLPGITPYNNIATSCFGFFTAGGSDNVNAMAVEVPPQLVKSTFGKALGFGGQDVTDIAYASIQTAQSGGGILPFAYPGANGLVCVATSSQPPCKGFVSSSGTYGPIDSPRLVTFLGSSNSNGNNNSYLNVDLNLGLDHPLNVWQAAVGQVCDTASNSCQPNDSMAGYLDKANYVEPTTGQNNMAGALFTGFTYTGPNPHPPTCPFGPRLAHSSAFVVSSSCSYYQTTPATDPTDGGTISVPLLSGSDTFGYSGHLNGQNIAAFVNSYGQGTYASGCGQLLPNSTSWSSTGWQSVPIDSTTYSWDAFDQCLANLITSSVPSGPIFTTSIEQSPRFGIVPVVVPVNGSNPEEIVGFEDVYLDMAYGSCSGSSGSCTVTALKAWVFPGTYVAGTSAKGGGGVGGYFGGQYVTNLCYFRSSSDTNC